MDYNDFTAWCVGMGLWVSKAGLIYDDDYDYCALKGDHVDTFGKDRKSHPLKGIKEISYTQNDHALTLTYSQSEKVTLHGVKLSSRDNVVLSQMAVMPSTMRELNSVIDVLFPEIDDKLFFDVLNEQIAFNPSLLGLDSGDDTPIMFNDEHVPTYILKLQNRLFEEGFIGKRPPAKEVCLDVLKYRAFKNQRNLFREWLESLKWDGKPRMRRWFIDGLGVTAPALEPIGRDQAYLEAATEAWFMGTIGRQYKATKVEVVPVFIGGEGIGKGNFLRYTAGYNDAWFIDTSASLEGAGAEQKFLESIRGRIIVELSESTQFSTPKGAELLKAFVSKTEDQCRKAYAAFQTTSVRRFTLVATSNLHDVFIDTGGGNRRYFPMYCDPDKAILPFDPTNRVIGRTTMEQVWAEALHTYRTNSGATTFVSKETAELAAIMQDYGTQEDSSANLIEEWLEDPVNGYTERGALISKQTIIRDILHCDPYSLLPRGAEFAFNAWTRIQKCWRKLPKPTRIDGKTSRTVYERIHIPDDFKEKKRSNMVNVRPEDIADFIDVVGIMRSGARKFGFSKTGDEFPTGWLSEEEVEALRNEGYIYMDGVGGYRVGFMP